MLLVIMGQLILNCPIGVFKSTKKKKKKKNFARISALASKKRSNKKKYLKLSYFKKQRILAF